VSATTTPAGTAQAPTTTLGKMLRQNARDYGMYIALAVIMIIFEITTKGLFLSPRNISDLLNQTGYIAVLAVGMTLVIIIRHIDLSVGFLAGLCGAIAAILLTKAALPVYIVIPITFLVGIAAGTLTGFLVAKVGIPAFVATLAGWLAYRGALLLVLAGTGTIIINNKFFVALGNGFIPDIMSKAALIPGMHKLTLLLGILAIVLFIYSQISSRRTKISYGFEVLPTNLFLLKLILLTLLFAAMTWILAGWNGLSWTVVIMLVVVGIYHFITTKTVLGRHIYALGGNPEAAALSGVNVKRITFTVFMSMGLLTALAGMLFASRLRSATPQAGNLFELDCIAAAFIGGASPAGGIGTIIGSLIGALVYMSLTNGMNLMGVDIAWQYIVRGLVLALAVIFDVTTRRAAH
jgi:putative multiple sugar transport system permease protein